jgi:predicted DCC family thiol-disulfide oxidoreductase YuxK
MTATRVLFNDSCPVCRAEIGAYASYCSAQGMEIGFDDLNKSDLADWGVTAEEAAMRLHVFKDGHVLSGVPAFMALWEEMPRYRWLARAVGLPGIRQLATFVYDRILAPALFRAHLRRKRRSKKQSYTDG